MADTTPDHLFELSLDRESIDHLTETARWGKFLAILGFITIGLLVIFSFFVGAIFSNMAAISPYPSTEIRTASSIGAAFFTVTFLIVAVIYFFPCLYLYRYSVQMKVALNTNDQVKLNQSLKSQKMLFRYVGIVTIIGISLELIILLIGGAFNLVSSH